MQLFLKTQCGLEVSLPTISRQVRKAYGGTFLRTGRCARIRSRKQREAEGRSIALELQQNPSGESNNSQSADQTATPDSFPGQQQEDGVSPGIQTAAPGGIYHDQRQLAPLDQILGPQHQPLGESQGQIYHDMNGQHYQGERLN